VVAKVSSCRRALVEGGGERVSGVDVGVRVGDCQDVTAAIVIDRRRSDGDIGLTVRARTERQPTPEEDEEATSDNDDYLNRSRRGWTRDSCRGRTLVISRSVWILTAQNVGSKVRWNDFARDPGYCILQLFPRLISRALPLAPDSTAQQTPVTGGGGSGGLEVA
jgi:hypothetical protein